MRFGRISADNSSKSHAARPASPQRAFGGVADGQLPADPREILAPFHVPAVDAAPKEPVDAGGEHLAQQVMHRRQPVQRGEPLGVPLLSVSPRVAEEVVDVEDRDGFQVARCP